MVSNVEMLPCQGDYLSNGFYVQVLPSCRLSGLVVTQMGGFFIHYSLTDPKINSLFNYREDSNDRGRCGFGSTIKFPRGCLCVETHHTLCMCGIHYTLCPISFVSGK